jgi:DMSO reductase anchor subunit
VEDAQGDAFLPGAPSPGITIPTTVYKTERALPRNLLPADFYRVAPSHRHAPLVVMLVLTQLSVGAFVVDAIESRAVPEHALATQELVHAIVALAVGLAALAASVFHLGRPHYAFRAVLGLRTSWMSREIAAFGLFATAAVAYAAASFAGAGIERGLHEALRWTVAALGVVGIACSVAIYHATRRAWWTASITGFKFFLTAALLGLATAIVTGSAYGDRPGVAAALSFAVAVVSVVKAAGEATLFLHLGDKRHTVLKRSALLAANDLRGWSVARFVALVLGGIVLPLANASRGSLGVAIVSLVMLALGELAERTLFFAASSSPGMPGAVR